MISKSNLYKLFKNNFLKEKLSERIKEPSPKDINIDYFDSIPDYGSYDAPFYFSSGLCREQHFHSPLYQYWCKKLGENPRFHRKQWEFVFIAHSLFERGYLKKVKSGIGFGVGREPLVSYFASCGVNILATDLEYERAHALGWVDTEQHCENLSFLNERGLCGKSLFEKHVNFQSLDMNNIPNDTGNFDFCWSSCAFEHLGSIQAGINFVLNSAKLLKPGGIGVHTTEFNLSSDIETLDNNPSFVIYRKRDIEKLVSALEANGFYVEPVNFSSGEDFLEKYVDMPPYKGQPHLRLLLAEKYVATSIGLIVRAPK